MEKRFDTHLTFYHSFVWQYSKHIAGKIGEQRAYMSSLRSKDLYMVFIAWEAY